MSECTVDRQCPPVREICHDYGKCTTHGTCDGNGRDGGGCQCTVNVMCDRANEGNGGKGKNGGIVEQLRGGGKARLAFQKYTLIGHLLSFSPFVERVQMANPCVIL